MATTFRGFRVSTTAARVIPLGRDRREVSLVISPTQGGAGLVYVSDNRGVTSTNGVQVPFGTISTFRIDPQVELFAITDTGTQLLGVVVTEPADVSWEILLRQVIPLIQQSIANQQALIQMLAGAGAGQAARAAVQQVARGAPASMGPAPRHGAAGLVLPEPFWGQR